MYSLCGLNKGRSCEMFYGGRKKPQAKIFVLIICLIKLSVFKRSFSFLPSQFLTFFSFSLNSFLIFAIVILHSNFIHRSENDEGKKKREEKILKGPYN